MGSALICNLVSNGVVSRTGTKWKHSDSSDFDSVELMTPLRMLSFEFHQVICIPTTLTATLLLVKTSPRKVLPVH